MTEEKLKALLVLSELPFTAYCKITNEYWPDHNNFDNVRKESPWWLVETIYGTIVIGWRKRVIEISWKGCRFRGELCSDDVTKSDTLIHAWDLVHALDYLIRLNQSLYRMTPEDPVIVKLYKWTLANQGFIPAMKLYRSNTGACLRDAKQYIDSLSGDRDSSDV